MPLNLLPREPPPPYPLPVEACDDAETVLSRPPRAEGLRPSELCDVYDTGGLADADTDPDVLVEADAAEKLDITDELMAVVAEGDCPMSVRLAAGRLSARPSADGTLIPKVDPV
jgi:hypothetical protein